MMSPRERSEEYDACVDVAGAGGVTVFSWPEIVITGSGVKLWPDCGQPKQGGKESAFGRFGTSPPSVI
jgi:hypothetical protein